MKKIAICGGHLTPALSLIEQLETEKDLEIVFFGRKYSAEGTKVPSAEYRLIKEKGIKFVEVTAGRLQRKFTKYTLLSIAKTPIGFAQSLIYLRREKPAIVVSFGGYVSLPVIFAASVLKIKCITHEQSLIPGLATKINAKFCDKVFLSWPKTQKYFNDKKTRVIGNLIRSDIFTKTAKSKNIQEYVSSPKKLLLILGGNQGSHFLNQLILNSLGSLRDYNILHQVGALNFKGDLDKAKEKTSEGYFPMEYLAGADFGAAINRAHIIISRSGANTVWDIATLAKVAIFVPLPIAASGEQLANARELEEAGSALILNQNEATPQTLTETIRSIEKNFEKHQNSAKILSAKIPKDAAKKLVKAVLSYT